MLHLEARVRPNLAVLHLLSAAQFSRRAQELEAAHAGKSLGPFWDDIYANSAASVLLSAASVEAYVNEVSFDLPDKLEGDRAKAVFSKLWNYAERDGVLAKADVILLMCEKPALDRKREPCLSISALIELRNSLMHFKPEWLEEQKRHDELSRLLVSKFRKSRFFGSSEPYFPRGWVGHSCTAWAVTTATSFINNLEDVADIPQRIRKFGKRIEPSVGEHES